MLTIPTKIFIFEQKSLVTFCGLVNTSSWQNGQSCHQATTFSCKLWPWGWMILNIYIVATTTFDSAYSFISQSFVIQVSRTSASQSLSDKGRWSSDSDPIKGNVWQSNARWFKKPVWWSGGRVAAKRCRPDMPCLTSTRDQNAKNAFPPSCWVPLRPRKGYRKAGNVTNRWRR